METDSLNTFSFEDILESLVSIEISSCFVIEVWQGLYIESVKIQCYVKKVYNFKVTFND